MRIGYRASTSSRKKLNGRVFVRTVTTARRPPRSAEAPSTESSRRTGSPAGDEKEVASPTAPGVIEAFFASPPDSSIRPSTGPRSQTTATSRAASVRAGAESAPTHPADATSVASRIGPTPLPIRRIPMIASWCCAPERDLRPSTHGAFASRASPATWRMVGRHSEAEHAVPTSSLGRRPRGRAASLAGGRRDPALPQLRAGHLLPGGRRPAHGRGRLAREELRGPREGPEDRQGLPRDPPQPRDERPRDDAEGEAVLREPGDQDRGRDHSRRRRGLRVQAVQLHEPRAPEARRGGGPLHGGSLRRADPRRLLLHDHEDRERHQGEGRAELERVPPRR